MKYNDNGQFKPLYVKALDSMPVGTEVDYDGQDIPTGWEEVEGNRVILYDNTSGSNGDITLSDNLSNYDYIDIVFGGSNGNYKTFFRFDANNTDINLSRSVNVVYGNDEYTNFNPISKYSLQNNILTFINCIQIDSSTKTGVVVEQIANANYIFKVIGYKEV